MCPPEIIRRESPRPTLPDLHWESPRPSPPESEQDEDEGGVEILEQICAFSTPLAAPWPESRVIPADGWERMKTGIRPRDMDDRWVVAHVPDLGNGEEGIVIARSWTGYPLAQIAVIEGDGGGRKITSITWETDTTRWNVEDAEAEAKDLVVRFARDPFEVDLV